MSIKASSFFEFVNEGMMDEVQAFYMGWFCVWAKGIYLGLEALTNRATYALTLNVALLGP